MRTNRWKQFVIGCAMAALLTALLPNAEAGPNMRRVARAQRIESSQEAAAALTAVGAAAGWGRIKVEDKLRDSVAKREVEVDLFDMDPMVTFLIEADGVFLGFITTDASGWGSLKLETDDNSHLPVPSELRPAGELVSASVRDESDAFVLEGSFVGFADGEDDTTIHEEKISLSDVLGTGAAGVAKVEREADGTQEFDTRATGLIPAASYSILIDGFAAGMRTADSVGQARLKLESPDDEDPLPSALQPVEDLRVVEWYDGEGFLVLAGAFNGISNDDDGDDNGGNSGSDDGGNSGSDDGGNSGSDDGGNSGSGDGGSSGSDGGGNSGPGGGDD